MSVTYNVAASYGTVIRVSNDNGVNWTTSTVTPSVTAIRSITSNSTGTFIAVSSNVNAYKSTNTGSTFTPCASGSNYRNVVSNGDGSFLVGYNTKIYKSTDNGTTWIDLLGPSTTWTTVDVSKTAGGSGYTIVAADSANIYISYNSGSTWTTKTTFPAGISKSWVGITCSADGTKMAACSNNTSQGAIIYSLNSGSTWLLGNTGGIKGRFKSIASSNDGTTLFCCRESSGIWKSIDSGVNWSFTALSKVWTSIECSPDGRFAVLVGSSSNIYTSTDGGSWIERTNSTSNSWTDVTIYKVLVSSITASPSSITNLQVTGTQQITPTVLPASAINKAVTYSSSNTSIATVNATGLVTGVGVGGPINITISATDGSGVTGIVPVTVVPTAVSSITSSPTSITNLEVTGSQQLTPTILPTNATNKAVAYSSSNTSIATVSANGLVTGTGVGGPINITISATDGSGVTRIIPVTVVPTAVSSIVADPISIPSLTIGTVREITYTAFPANATNKAVTYSSSNTSIATVSATGVVTGVGVGGPINIIISATDGSGVKTSVLVTVTPVYVSSIIAQPTSITIYDGDTQQVTYTVLPVNATYTNVTYLSSDRTIAKVDSTGLVTALLPGNANIILTAIDGSSIYTSIPITVNQVYVQSITPSPVSITSLNVGFLRQIIPTILPANASYKDVTYLSSDTTIATVISGGFVKGIALGNAAITISATDGSGINTTVPVTVTPVLVTSIISSPSAISSLRVGNTQKLTTTVLPFTAANKSLIYSSSNTNVARVSSVGLVTGVSVGNVVLTISASDDSGVFTTVSVKIVPIYVSGIRLSSGSIPYFRVGDTRQLTPTVLPSNAANTAVTYLSSDVTKVTVSSTGLLTGLILGNATITISATDGSGIKTLLPVTITPILVTSIKANPISISTITVGATQQLIPTVLPANSTNKAVAYLSSNTKIATVSSTGLVTGVSIGGPVNIMITAKDGSRVAVAVPVIVAAIPVTSITSVPNIVSTLTIGGTQQLVSTVLPTNASDKAVTYLSSNTNIATVSANGLVTGLAIGGPFNIMITSKFNSRITSIVPVTVTPIFVTSITASPSILSALKIGAKQQLTPNVLPSNANNKDVTYSSSNASIARVSPNGLVTAVATGTVNIVISAMDGSGIKKNVSVTVVPILVTSITSSSIPGLVVGTTQKITPTILPVNATNKVLTYTSSDTSKVTVRAGGFVKGLAVGFANIAIAATDGSGVTQSISVTVVKQ
jgi:uncharacterized protein YjdB